MLPVSEKFADYGARGARASSRAAGVRVELDDRSEKLGYKIREAQLQKVPYMLVVGAREAEAGTVAVRLRAGEDLGALAVAEIAARMGERVKSKSLEL